MKIHIQSPDNSPFTLIIPTGMVLYPATLTVLLRFWNKRNIPVTGKQAAVFLRALRVYRKTHPAWVLAEITSENGRCVRIML